MHFRVAAIGQRMPEWVNTGWQEYARRFPRAPRLELLELPMEKRGKNPDIQRLKNIESDRLSAAVPANACAIALDVGGRQWSTSELADQMRNWMRNGRDVCFLVGGPDGMTSACVKTADQCWSLGALTLPHPLVRVILAEQLYRAWTVVNNHPYHRE